jgi:hypothetical protein
VASLWPRRVRRTRPRKACPRRASTMCMCRVAISSRSMSRAWSRKSWRGGADNSDLPPDALCRE